MGGDENPGDGKGTAAPEFKGFGVSEVGKTANHDFQKKDWKKAKSCIVF